MFTNRLEGKSVLITGATSGIGEATARLMAASGALVGITGRRSERLDQLAEVLRGDYDAEVETGAFDIRDREACRRFVAEFKQPVDVLVNNAGLASGTGTIYAGEFEDWDTMIDTNIKGLLTMTRLVSPDMRERDDGHIINVGSVAGHEAYPGGGVYCATKHAVKAITEAAKKDLHGTRVRVSMVSPGLVNTEFSKVRYKGDQTKADKVYKNMRPLEAGDVAELIHFIANRPAHVNIMDSIIFPTAQSSASMIHRDE